MVTNISSLTGSGLKDWVIQRLSAVYLAIYSLYLFFFLVFHRNLTYQEWLGFFQCRWVAIATVFALLALTLHSWIGLWTVSTDYLQCRVLRFSIQLLLFAGLFGQFIWGLMIVWGR